MKYLSAFVVIVGALGIGGCTPSAEALLAFPVLGWRSRFRQHNRLA
jgi:hypothetical protein